MGIGLGVEVKEVGLCIMKGGCYLCWVDVLNLFDCWFGLIWIWVAMPIVGVVVNGRVVWLGIVLSM